MKYCLMIINQTKHLYYYSKLNSLTKNPKVAKQYDTWMHCQTDAKKYKHIYNAYAINENGSIIKLFK